MFPSVFLALVLTGGIFFNVSCAPERSKTTTVQSSRSPSLLNQQDQGPYLKVAGPPLRHLKPIEKKNYDRDDANQLFHELNALGNPYCEKRFASGNDHSPGFIRDEYRSNYEKGHRGPLQDLITGCWNFYEMNDYRPDLDFRLARSFLQNQQADCYSVGLLQPYLMDHFIQCQRVTMLDIDWRILEAHHRILGSISKNETRTLFEAMNQMKLFWFAYNPKTGKGVHTPARSFCREIQEKECLNWMKTIQPNQDLDRYHLVLSPLSEAPFHSSLPDTVPVLFLSNAIEDMYTSKEEFDSLLKHLNQSLDAGERALLIHHVGGWKLFGVYELSAIKDNNFSIRTLCKDRYLSRGRSSDGNRAVEYRTHFEALTVTRNPPTCASLLNQQNFSQ